MDTPQLMDALFYQVPRFGELTYPSRDIPEVRTAVCLKQRHGREAWPGVSKPVSHFSAS